MKKKIRSTFVLTAFFAVAIIGVSSLTESVTMSAYANTFGSPGGRTNSLSDNSNCTACHSGTINSGTGIGLITAPGLVSGYVAGQTYTITASIAETGISKFGFEITAEKDADNSKTGTLILTDVARTTLVNSNNAITHTSIGTPSLTTGANSWSFDWTAPTSGTGGVTFYAAFNASNGAGTGGGDQIYSTSFNVTESTVGINDLVGNSKSVLYPNPAVNYFKVSSNNIIENVTVFDLNGKIMVSNNQPNGKINVESLSSGIYFVQVKSDNIISTEKLIVK
jgi:hypothetical protein